MKTLAAFLLILALATLACGLDFNPPPLSFTQPAPQPSSPPIIIQATQTANPTSVPPSPTVTAPAPTETVRPTQAAPTATETQPSPTLTINQLRNASIEVRGSDQILRTATLIDGKYEANSDSTQPDYVIATVGDKFAFGDLNGDGLEDAVMILGENVGGTGEFVSLITFLNQGGQPVYTSRAEIEDRAQVQSLDIQNDEILLNIIVHGPGDPQCCASLVSTRNYRLIENALVLSRLTTVTSSNSERIIQIVSPVNGTQVSGAFILLGSVSISPFENNLVYTVYTQNGTTALDQGGFTIQGDGLGGPGTFELPLNFANIGLQGPVRIQIADISAADGSYLAINTVFLVLK